MAKNSTITQLSFCATIFELLFTFFTILTIYLWLFCYFGQPSHSWDICCPHTCVSTSGSWNCCPASCSTGRSTWASRSRYLPTHVSFLCIPYQIYLYIICFSILQSVTVGYPNFFRYRYLFPVPNFSATGSGTYFRYQIFQYQFRRSGTKFWYKIFPVPVVFSVPNFTGAGSGAFSGTT